MKNKDEEYYLVRMNKEGNQPPFFNLDLMGPGNYNLQYHNQ